MISQRLILCKRNLSSFARQVFHQLSMLKLKRFTSSRNYTIKNLERKRNHLSGKIVNLMKAKWRNIKSGTKILIFQRIEAKNNS
jgi:hypothetical protein